MCTGQLSVGGLTNIDFHSEPKQNYVLSLVKNLLTIVPFLSQGLCTEEPENKVTCLCYPTTANL